MGLINLMPQGDGAVAVPLRSLLFTAQSGTAAVMCVAYHQEHDIYVS